MNPQPSPAVTTGQTPAKRPSKRLILFSVIGALIIAGVIAYFAWYNSTGQGYWDGGQYAGQPVYSNTHGISRTLHFEFQACGIGDSDILDAVDKAENETADAVVVIIPNGPTVDIKMVYVDPGIYSLTCQKVSG